MYQMHPNVNRAFLHGVDMIKHYGEMNETRNGTAFVYPTPVFTCFQKPEQRVLFSKVRKANPFFHLFEAMWMLGGKDDAKFLNRYVKDFGERFAELDGFLHGAYGWRWLNNWGFDQIETAIDILIDNPNSRRAVITMWDPNSDLGVDFKDIPCNTHIYCRVREEPIRFYNSEEIGIKKVLDLTVCCRSNDAIWGLFGSNAVHFSVLQEYIAWRLDASMGAMYILSNNLHVYTNTAHLHSHGEPDFDLYSQCNAAGTPLAVNTPLFKGCNPKTLHSELALWLDDPLATRSNANPIFGELLVPMARTHEAWKNDVNITAAGVEHILHQDWRMAVLLWLEQHPRNK